MMRFGVSVALLLAVALGTAGCAAKPMSTVSGRVTLGEAAGYPVGTVLRVRVADVSTRPARQVAESGESLDPGWEAPGTHPPRDFEVKYDATGAPASRTYVVWAEVRDGDKLVAASVPSTIAAGGQPVTGVALGLMPAAVLPTSSPLPLP